MDDLVKRLREVAEEKHREAWGRLDGGQDISISAMLAEEAADRIEELALKLLAAEGQAADNLDRAESLRKENERLRGMLKAEAIGALWVCPDCDIARCKHYRAALQGEKG